MAAKRVALSGPALAAGLARVRPALAAWRQRRRHREAIPENLWCLIVPLAQSHGVSSVARALRLNYTALRQRTLAGRAPVLAGKPYHLCHMAFVIFGTIRPLGFLDSLVPWARSSGLCCGGERSEPERHSPEERARRLAGLPMSRQTLTSHRHDQ